MVVAECVCVCVCQGPQGQHLCTSKAVSDSDIVSTIVTVRHGMTVGTGHTWSSTEVYYGGQILLNKGVDLLAFTPMDQPISSHHHIIVSISGVLQGPMTWGGLRVVLRREGLA